MEEKLRQSTYLGTRDILKITLFGPESTGKTTLSKQLAEAFDTNWTPEFAREYLQEKWNRTQTTCEPDDLLPIAFGQVLSENDALLLANKLLFCDTNLLLTKVYSELYYNFCDPMLEKAGIEHQYDLFFLTNVDVPWESDDLRVKPEQRQNIFLYYKQTLEKYNKPYITLSGSKEERLQKSIHIINQLIIAKSIGFSSHDFVQIYNHGIDTNDINNQLDTFERGFPKINLLKPATIGDGIQKYTMEDFQKLASFFDKNKKHYKLKKMVPASGAASRMFKFLEDFLKNFKPETQTINAYINQNEASALAVFLAGMEKLPFFEQIHQRLIQNPDFERWTADQKNYTFIKTLLQDPDFEYANKPKGILPFHKKNDSISTALEAHLVEVAMYANATDKCYLHFTVTEEHESAFEAIVVAQKEAVEKKYKCNIAVSYSYQKKSTDTIAVDASNKILRNEDGTLIFRPGGHGALINNLNEIDADIVFIKNIDNVSRSEKTAIALYKKALGGILIQIQNQIHHFRQLLDKNPKLNQIDEMFDFIKNTLQTPIKEEVNKFTTDNKIQFLLDFFDRPIRVCGMVKNEDEPGGGPFWVKNEDGTISLQIVESAQIDLSDKTQVNILKSSTHFNPVDLVCGLKNHNGQQYDLSKYIDSNTGFIVEKTKNGVQLKGLELPGLWNGAMAHWITIFVEVPIETFNPVKTVNDLLKAMHQG